jgi:hypothetical protein
MANVILEDVSYLAGGVEDLFTGQTGTGTASPIPSVTYNPGPLVPPGGTTGQVLAKTDGVNFHTQWNTPAAPTVYLLFRVLPAAVNDFIEIGTLFRIHGAHNFRLSVTVSDSGYSLSKTFIVTTAYHVVPTAWLILTPTSDTGSFFGSNFGVDILINTATTYLRLRTTAGTTANAYVVIEDVSYLADGGDLFTPTSATGTASPVPSVPYP